MSTPRTRTPRFSFTRADYRVTSLLIVLGAIIYPGLVLVPQLIRWASGGSLVWIGHVSRVGPTVPGAALAPTQVHYSDEVVWTIRGATAGQWLGSLMSPLLTTACIIAGAILLIRLVSRARAGIPFDRGSVRLLRALAIVVLTYAAFAPSLPLLSGLVVAGPVNADGSLAGTFDLSAFLPFLVGMLILVLAECFRIGADLRSDVEGLI